MKHIKLIFLCWIFVFLLLRCGYYSFSGSSIPSHLKTVAIPVMDNKTVEFGVPEDLTDALIAMFTRDNSLKVVDRRSADSIIEGTIVNIRDQAGAYNQEETVKEIRVYVIVQAKFEDLKKNKIMWEEQITQWGTYSPDGSTGESATRQEAIAEAMEKIVDDIFNKTVSGW